MSHRVDVAVVGAGFAGLAAACELVDHGFSVELFEATDRLGGRAHTLHAEAELGPEFVHGCPEVTLELVRASKLALEPSGAAHHIWRDGRLVEMGDLWQRFGNVLEPATHPGAADESVRAFLERAQLPPDHARMLAVFVEGFYAAPLDDISLRSMAEDIAAAAGDDGQPQARIRGGYGRLVDALAERLARARVPIRFGHVVHAIDYTSDRVRIEHSHGSSLARRVIVTLPVGVLHAGSVRFQPALAEHATALSHFAMGQAVKVVLCLRQPVWRDYGPRDLELIHRYDGAFPTFWLHSPPQFHQLVAWAGGPHAKALAGCSEHQLVERVVDEFASTLAMPRSVLASAIVHRHFHDYAADRFAYGAYSYTRVGGMGAADVLARPLADRLFFAGEATDIEYEGTVAGAIASGQRAARQILSLDLRSRTGTALASAHVG